VNHRGIARAGKMGRKNAPAFGNISGAGKSSLRARDAGEGGRGGKRLLNRGMTSNKRNKNYIERNEMSRHEFNENPVVKEKGDDHQLAAKLGFEHFTDGPDRLGWLLNMNSVCVFLEKRPCRDNVGRI